MKEEKEVNKEERKRERKRVREKKEKKKQNEESDVACLVPVSIPHHSTKLGMVAHSYSSSM